MTKSSDHRRIRKWWTAVHIALGAEPGQDVLSTEQVKKATLAFQYGMKPVTFAEQVRRENAA